MQIQINNTFVVEFINLFVTSIEEYRKYTTISQSFYKIGNLIQPLPIFLVTLGTDGNDWFDALEKIKLLKNRSFYKDDPSVSVQFRIIFDFIYCISSLEERLYFQLKAKLALQ